MKSEPFRKAFGAMKRLNLTEQRQVWTMANRFTLRKIDKANQYKIKMKRRGK